VTGTTRTRDEPTGPADPWESTIRFGVVLALALFAAFPGIALGTQSWFNRDYGVLGYPFIQYHRDCFWRGELPLWNPLSNCGAPFLAQWGTMTLYPFSLVYLLLPLPWSLNLFCLLHLLLAGIGMYSLARKWIGTALPSAFAASAFVFSGLMLSCINWPNYLVALGWMPWVLLAAEAAWSRGGRALAWAGVLGALQMLAGAPEIALMTWALLAAACMAGTGDAPAPMTTRLMRFGVVILLVAGLCAAQLMPFFDLLAHSQRDRAFATAKWAMPGWGWANLMVPLYHYFMTPQQTYFQSGQEFFSSYYLGAGVLGLALAGFWKVRSPRVWLLAAASVCGLVLAMGDEGYLYGWLRRVIPVLGVGRYPVKLVLLAGFAVPLLAAWGLNWLLKPESIATRVMIGIGAALALATGAVVWLAIQFPFPYDQVELTWRNALVRAALAAGLFGVISVYRNQVEHRVRLGLGALLLGIPMLDGLTHLPRQNPTVPSDSFTAGMIRQKQALEPAPVIGRSRVFISSSAERHLLLSGVPDLTHDFLIKRLAFWSNLNALDQVPKVNGSSTLQIAEQAQVQKLLYATGAPDHPRLLDFLAASHESVRGQVFLWTNRPSALPWVTAGQRPILSDRDATLAAMTNGAFDPAREVYLPPEARDVLHATGGVSAQATVKHFSANLREIEVNSSGPTLLVLAESHYPNWTATVDGRPSTLWRANHAFQAIEVPAGHSAVRLVYRDRRFERGVVISLATLVVCVVIHFHRPRIRKPAGNPTAPFSPPSPPAG
jgi:hypothetical protein